MLKCVPKLLLYSPRFTIILANLIVCRRLALNYHGLIRSFFSCHIVKSNNLVTPVFILFSHSYSKVAIMLLSTLKKKISYNIKMRLSEISDARWESFNPEYRDSFLASYQGINSLLSLVAMVQKYLVYRYWIRFI